MEILIVAGALGVAWAIVRTVRLIVRDGYGPIPTRDPWAEAEG